ncbi:alpha/beta hydrolase fold domain-containing protein [Salipiger sp. 1_MG-2023]|uniref:alpha/beta hydrolase n=1 Tax=Salipiger sp. 1_MG-2023 TaxID=3062665 RepID=UPI0026E29958|nr:alpha/beta hydrolase fold domain-containing protein [Salipiger sp. 1_MG-2023]MDO6587219.1 alpha/beta hydrolase fold domain-containing protein [Salipiger sp. 1_MG-2023]
MTHRPRSEAELRAHIARVAMDGDIAARRDGFARLAGPQPVGEPLELGGVPCRAIGTGPDLLWLHGGGYVFGSAQTHLMLAAALAKTGLRVILPDYRLAPEHPWPAMLEDALAVLGALGPVCVGGDSAGGHLALALARRQPCLGLALISPNTDRTGRCTTRQRGSDAMNDDATDAWLGRIALPGLPPDDPDVSPLGSDLSGLPPLHLELAGAEILLDDGLLLARAAALQGVDVSLHVTPGLFHLFPLWPDAVAQGAAALGRIAAFARAASERNVGSAGTRSPLPG